jgi:protein-tyrosine phosphatase
MDMREALIDLHCHVLPGVDDGPADVEAAVGLARSLEALGLTELYPTPHQAASTWAPRPEEAEAAAETLRTALAAAGSSVRIHPPAGENMWDELFLARFAGGYPTYPGGKAFLLELPTEGTPPGLHDRLFQLRVGGMLPVVAHVERYVDLTRAPRRIEALGRTAALTVNLSTLGGMGGWGVRRLARRLVRDRLVHAVASDAHGSEDATLAASGLRWILEDLGEEVLQRLLADHPRRILSGELPEW